MVGNGPVYGVVHGVSGYYRCNAKIDGGSCLQRIVCHRKSDRGVLWWWLLSLEPRLSFVGGPGTHSRCLRMRQIPSNPGNSDSSVKYHVYYSVY